MAASKTPISCSNLGGGCHVVIGGGQLTRVFAILLQVSFEKLQITRRGTSQEEKKTWHHSIGQQWSKFAPVLGVYSLYCYIYIIKLKCKVSLFNKHPFEKMTCAWCQACGVSTLCIDTVLSNWCNRSLFLFSFEASGMYRICKQCIDRKVLEFKKRNNVLCIKLNKKSYCCPYLECMV